MTTSPHDPSRGFLDTEHIDAGSDFLDGERFAGCTSGYTYEDWYGHVDPDHRESRRSAHEWAAVKRGPRASQRRSSALVNLFIRTYAWVILGTMICALIVCPPLAPFMLAGGVVVGIPVGLVMSIINTAVTAWAFDPPASKAAYRTYNRRLLYGLVAVTIGLGCGALVASLVADLSTGRYDSYDDNLLQLVEGVAYSIYAIVGCLLMARWIGRQIADDHVRAVWPELDVPLPTRRPRRDEQAMRGGVPWG